jgi:hypothetical protein
MVKVATISPTLMSQIGPPVSQSRPFLLPAGQPWCATRPGHASVTLPPSHETTDPEKTPHTRAIP